MKTSKKFMKTSKNIQREIQNKDILSLVSDGPPWYIALKHSFQNSTCYKVDILISFISGLDHHLASSAKQYKRSELCSDDNG